MKRRRRDNLGQKERTEGGACKTIRIERTHQEPDPSWDNPITFRAYTDGQEVGYLDAYRYPDTGVLKPALIEVNPEIRRCGVNTRLHNEAARYACDEGLTVISDQYRTPNTEKFWVKQRQKGRAECLPGKGYEISPEGDMDRVVGTWACERYRLRRCELDLGRHARPRRRRSPK